MAGGHGFLVMNYFEFYELPIQFGIDVNALRQKYFALSKQYHPDFFVNESEEKKENVLKNSTLNNNAFKALNNTALRIKYVLEITGTLTDAEKEILPQDFLMEMMELNEEMMEMDAATAPALRARVGEFEASLEAAMAEACNQFDNTSEQIYLQIVKSIYLKQKYLLRIKESMLKFAAL